jgi:H+/gluconate symporter-like permease
MTEIQTVIESFFRDNQSSGVVVIFVAYGLSAVLKVAQGSSTVAMIISSSLVASIALPLASSGDLGFHVAYLVPVIGAGSLMGSWMNDSGFWVFAKMGVLTEGETLRSWTILLCVLSLTGFLVSLTLAMLVPLV